MKKSLRKIIVPILSVVLCLFCLLCACASPPPENNDRDTDNGGFGNGNDGHLSASAHEHDLSYVPDVAPECTTAGSVAYWQWLSCGKYYADESAENELGVKDISLPAVGHRFKAAVAAPTCTENGYALHKCEFCDESYIDKVVEKLGHDFVELAEESSPTCTANGERKIKCSRCDQTTVETLFATGHKYIETIVAPTCTVSGEVRNTCLYCGDAVVERSSPAGHKYKIAVIAATCTENGYALHKCEFCDESYIDKVVEKLGHDFVELAEESSPTCTANGERKIKCSRCDQTTVEVLSAIGHEYTATAVAPTCTVDGYTSYKCSACGDEFFDNVTAARGHEYSSEWDRDDDSHWRAAICGCAISTEKIAHLFVDGRCETCGKEQSLYRLEYAETNGGLTVTGIAVSAQVDGKSLDVVIPSEHDGQAVTAIADGAFVGNKTIKSVYIPSTVKRIGKGAFKDCSVDSVELGTVDGWKSATTSAASSGTKITWGKPTQIADSLKREYKNLYLFCT